ncbi:MAG TPA: hypothetical protein PK370_02835 [Candidatus Woesebacteria bacterium]|nr:hypothetical protein [Candidatus Woesebacteria bacterium]HPJ16639.1 hypothetical protein [Candidatus Woesebacteria bacterium]
MIKKILIMLVAGFMALSAVNNLRIQYDSLKAAEENLLITKNELEEIQDKIKNLKFLIEYQKSDEYQYRILRGVYGLGDENNIWVEYPKKELEDPNENKFFEDRTIPNWLKWWELFTKQKSVIE